MTGPRPDRCATAFLMPRSCACVSYSDFYTELDGVLVWKAMAAMPFVNKPSKAWAGDGRNDNQDRRRSNARSSKESDGSLLLSDSSRGTAIRPRKRSTSVALGPETAVVAVDVGKVQTAVLVTDAQPRRLLGPLEFPNTGSGVTQLITRSRAVLPAGLTRVGGGGCRSLSSGLVCSTFLDG